MLASVMDLMLAIAATVAGYLAVAGARFMINPKTFRFPQLPFWVGLTATLFLLVLYLTVAWALTGRSLGAAVMGLRVINRRGGQPRLPISLVRAVLSVFVPLGLFWCLVARERRSVQDVICGTLVVYDWSSGSASGSLMPRVRRPASSPFGESDGESEASPAD
jgi:uncharacterized RDD family membrane protein YckC